MSPVLTCQAVGKDLLKELQAWRQVRFSEWNRTTTDRLQDIKMDQSGKLMDMDSHDGRIKLHYNEELVVLLREVRFHVLYAHSPYAKTKRLNSFLLRVVANERQVQSYLMQKFLLYLICSSQNCISDCHGQ